MVRGVTFIPKISLFAGTSSAAPLFVRAQVAIFITGVGTHMTYFPERLRMPALFHPPDRKQPVPDLARADRSAFLDAAWQTLFRLGFPLARIWWRLRRQRHEGALVAIYVGQALLLVRSSYRSAWGFPGGGVQRNEAPEAAARRELAEEIGLAPCELIPAGFTSGVWDGRREKVHLFELRLDRMPQLRLDNREIIDARLVSLNELAEMALTGPVAAYLEKALPA
jgi:8-oxo-dGTP diphosphatase